MCTPSGVEARNARAEADKNKLRIKTPDMLMIRNIKVCAPPHTSSPESAVERVWPIRDSHGQIMALVAW